MRKVERKLRCKRESLPEKYKKIDTSVNGDAEFLAENHKEVEKKLYPLRIDKRTVIYVTKDKLTQEYAEEKMERMKLIKSGQRKGGQAKSNIDIEEVRRMLDANMRIKDISENLGLSKTTISNFIRQNDLRK